MYTIALLCIRWMNLTDKILHLKDKREIIVLWFPPCRYDKIRILSPTGAVVRFPHFLPLNLRLFSRCSSSCITSSISPWETHLEVLLELGRQVTMKQWQILVFLWIIIPLIMIVFRRKSQSGNKGVHSLSRRGAQEQQQWVQPPWLFWLLPVSPAPALPFCGRGGWALLVVSAKGRQLFVKAVSLP